MNTDRRPLFRMFRELSFPRIAPLAFVLAALPQVSGALELDSVRIDACRGVACEAIHAASGSALIEIRGGAPADPARMLDLTVYNAATYEIAYYDTAEAPGGDFAFRVPLPNLRPGSYTFAVGRRYTGTIVAAGAFTAAAGTPPLPAWAPQVAEEFRR